MHRRDELNNFVSKAASERIINIMGASDTLADYLVSIRKKKKTKESRFIRKPRITSNMQKRSLVLEIWNATNNNNNSINNKRRNIAIDTTRTKRLKTIQPLESLIQPSDSVSKAGYQSSGCTLQPYFTKEEEHHRTQEHHHHHQYQFEFSSDLLDEISLHEMQSTIQSSESSIISQITQDSVLESGEEEEDDDDTEDNDSYSYSSEEDNYSNDEDESSSQSSPYHHHFEPSTEVKTSEVKEGAQLLLDLLCM